MQQNDDEGNFLVQDILDNGDLLIISNKGQGKTNTLMLLAREFREHARVIIFEDFPKFIHEFDEIPYFVVKDSDVVETKHTIDMEDYFLRHERDYSVRRGEEIKHALKENKDLIFLCQIEDIERQAFFIYSVIQHFYRKAYLRAYKNYKRQEKIVFVIEESQNVFDSSTISKKIFNRLRKMFSVSRNLGLHFILASQRLQDLNTKIRGRTRLMLRNISIDDWELKARRLLRHSKYQTEILKFPKGTFVYTPQDLKIHFPLFKQQGTPFVAETMPEKLPHPSQSFLKKLKKRFIAFFSPAKIPEKSSENVEEDEEEFGEEHAVLLAENEEEESESLFWT